MNVRTVENNMVREVIEFQVIQGLIGHSEDLSNDCDGKPLEGSE